MKLDTDDASVLVPASDREVKLFNAKRHEGPIAVRGEFNLDLNGTYTSPWNKRASQAFAGAFVESTNNYQCKDQTLIAKKFITHLRTIKSRYNDLHTGDAEDAEDEDADNDLPNNQATRVRTVGSAF